MNIEKRITKNKLTSENEYRKTNNEKQTNFSLLYSFGEQAYGLTHSKLTDYPIRVLVQLFISFFLFSVFFCKLLLEIVSMIKIYFPLLFPTHEHWSATNLEVV